MNNKRIYFFTFLLGLSLIGLLWIQFLWINNAVKQSEKDFDTDVKKSLSIIAEKLEEDSYCINFYSSGYIPPGQVLSLTSTTKEDELDTIPHYFNYQYDGIDSTIQYNDISFTYPIEIRNNMRVTILFNDSIPQDEMVVDSVSHFYQKKDPKINLSLLDTLLKKEFSSYMHDAVFDYSVFKTESNEVLYQSNELDKVHQDEDSYVQSVFLDDGFNTPYSIFVRFPDKNKIIWKSLWFVIVSSVVLLIVLIFLFLSFLKMLYSLKKLNEMRMDFINTMTHEFKTPVSNITLALKTLKGKSFTPEDLKYLDIIEEEKDRLYEGIDLVLTSALIEKQQLSLNKESAQVDALIRQTVRNNELKIQTKKAIIELDLSTDSFPIVLDAHHFKNVLDNMLNNALNYSDDGVRISITSRKIENQLEIIFEDTGHGISKEELQHIFDKFYRISTQNRYENKGFGIGLYYVKMILEAHEGNVNVESTPGVGTTFKINLPF